MNKALFTSQSDNWKTPERFYEELHKEFGFDFDPCPFVSDPCLSNYKFDGLNTYWAAINFCNPPYSRIADWVKKGFEEAQKGKTVVFLIPSRTDTRWWHDYIMKAKEIRFIKGRLRFQGAKYNAPFPSAVIIFSTTEE